MDILSHLLEEQTRLSEQGSRAKSDFLANMSHELRTPLNAIVGSSELMVDGKVQTEGERNEYLRDILASGRHLQQLINDILDLSKVEAGKMEFHAERILLSELIDELLNTLRVMAEDKRIELSSKVASEVEEVVLDRTRLKQVLYNYVSNALKFTPEGGRITVRVDPEGSKHFRLVVEDDREHGTWLERTLRAAGYVVDVAASGAQAIAKARERWFDAVTLDMLLPDMWGLNALKLIRAEGRNPDVSIVVLTQVSD